MSKLMMKNPKLVKMTSLHVLKAAMVLAFSRHKDVVPTWWRGVCKDQQGNDVVVMQVPKGDFDFTDLTLRTLSGYGIPRQDLIVVEGSSYNLIPIPTKHLTNYLPKRVTRKWLTDVISSTHSEWKKNVVQQLDTLGVTHLKMEYSGAGDSSNDDVWECFRSGEAQWYTASYHNDKGRHWMNQNEIKLPDDLCQLISEYVWNTLCQYDCVNNDGGGGDLTINLEHDEPMFLFSCYTNEMIHTTHQSDEEV